MLKAHHCFQLGQKYLRSLRVFLSPILYLHIMDEKMFENMKCEQTKKKGRLMTGFYEI